MKVLRRGVPPAEIVHVVTCSNCSSQLQFQRSEGKITYDQRDGDFITVQCPVCKEGVNADLQRSVYKRDDTPCPY